MMTLNRNHSSVRQRSIKTDSSFGFSASLFRVFFHSFLCFAAVILGFRLSDEARLMVISVRPFHETIFSNSFTRFYRAGNSGDVQGAPYVKDDREDFTPSSLFGSSSPAGLKSSRVHVGRHEILIRSWPHPNPVETLAAHRLIEEVQKEQQRVYSLHKRKRVIVVTPTYVRAFQAAYMSCLINTLRNAPGPLTWIVIEAGGISNETAELLSQSRLSYHHLSVQKLMPADLRPRKQLDIRMRLEGLRFVRNHRLDGVVIFLDDSNTYSLELFDVAQNINWIGTFSMGLPFHSGVPVLPEEGAEISRYPSNRPKEGKLDNASAADQSNALTSHERSSAVQKKSVSKPLLPWMGPVCNPEGYVVGWYVSFANEQEEIRSPSRILEWAGFALSSRILWEDASKPSWMKSWNELFGKNKSLPESPLAFLKSNAYIEPLGDCGRKVLMWRMPVEAAEGCKFPSRWMISPPLEVVVPARQTSRSPNFPESFHTGAQLLPIPPPPPPPHIQIPAVTIHGHVEGRVKGAKLKKGKHRSHPKREDQARRNSELTA